ncbi:adult-specific rigid cuticular protein 15.7-like [Dermacentor silvarum]|uniref:adult-specific rigid cuticular protein 15.7-like n=1 Tax=Dermacentor silvarum TaxID=543639 RepID=UPI002101487B|nr:adult-specific rigid cuticular protein 15.7-like [Dermacentor silvarum]
MALATESIGVYGLRQLPSPDYEYYDVPELPLTHRRSSSKTARKYKFDYNIADHEGNQQYRIERADTQNTKTGAYGYRNVNGIFRHVNYIADKYGFRTVVNTNEPGTAPMDSADAVFNAAPIKILPVKAPQHSIAAENIWYAGLAKEYGGRYGLRNGVPAPSKYHQQRQPEVDTDHIGFANPELNSDYYYE